MSAKQEAEATCASSFAEWTKRPNTPQSKQPSRQLQHSTAGADSDNGLQKMISTYSRRVLKDALCRPQVRSFGSPGLFWPDEPYSERPSCTPSGRTSQAGQRPWTSARGPASGPWSARRPKASGLGPALGPWSAQGPKAWDQGPAQGPKASGPWSAQGPKAGILRPAQGPWSAQGPKAWDQGPSVRREDRSFQGSKRNGRGKVSVPPAFYSLTALQDARSAQGPWALVCSGPHTAAHNVNINDAALQFQGEHGAMYVGLPREVTSLGVRETISSPGLSSAAALAADAKRGRRLPFKLPVYSASVPPERHDDFQCRYTVALPLL